MDDKEHQEIAELTKQAILNFNMLNNVFDSLRKKGCSVKFLLIDEKVDSKNRVESQRLLLEQFEEHVISLKELKVIKKIEF